MALRVGGARRLGAQRPDCLTRGHARRPGRWRIVEDVDLATLGWVHGNTTRRLCGYFGDLPPAAFEGRFHGTQQAATARSKSNSLSIHKTQSGSSLERAHDRLRVTFAAVSRAAGSSSTGITAVHTVHDDADGSRLDLSLDWCGPLARALELLIGHKVRGMVETEAETSRDPPSGTDRDIASTASRMVPTTPCLCPHRLGRPQAAHRHSPSMRLPEIGQRTAVSGRVLG